MYTNNVLHPEIIVKSVINTGSPLNDPAVLHDLYVQKGLSLKQMAALFASSKCLVRSALRKFDIPIRSVGIQQRPNSYNLPYGKKMAFGEVVDHPEEQKIIKLIVELHKAGSSNQAIAKHLDSRSIPTKKKNKGWNRETVRQILIRYKPMIST